MLQVFYLSIYFQRFVLTTPRWKLRISNSESSQIRLFALFYSIVQEARVRHAATLFEGRQKGELKTFKMHLQQILAFSFAALGSLVAAGPCDLYSAGGTPCIAAHSTTRALYSAFSGALYQVKRASDGTTTTISPLSAGGVANAAAQDTFCASTTCLITVIYDQSGKGNHLTQAPPGGFDGPDVNGYDNLASAIGAPVTLNGQKAYGVFVSPGTGYRNDVVSGSATGDEPEGMYAVLDGTHYNGACCFDYGNAETSNTDTGDGHMEAIYFGTETAVSPPNFLFVVILRAQWTSVLGWTRCSDLCGIIRNLLL